MNDEAWWRTAFSADYLDVYAHRDDAQAAVEIAALAPVLREAGGPILDAACGNGRHLVELRRQGFDAVGFDLSAALLERVRARPECRGRVIRADMRHPPLASGWGAILMLFTAFGYFDDADNAACLAGLAKLIKPGGRLILDQPDPDHVRKTLIPQSRRQGPRGLDILERRQLRGNRIEKDITVTDGGKTRSYRESVRLYSRDELGKIAASASLNMDQTWSSLRGSNLNEGRLVLFLRAGSRD
jgi:SAM-dependent methyltransferase